MNRTFKLLLKLEGATGSRLADGLVDFGGMMRFRGADKLRNDPNIR